MVLFLHQSKGFTMEITEKFSIGGILYGAYQYQDVSDDAGTESKGKGGMGFQPELSFTPTDNDEIFVKFGFGAGNALNDGTSPFTLSPWAADLEADVQDINGRNRDYLLEAWYKHTFQFGDTHSLGVGGGLIDATSFLDENVYANDELTQFMNEALVNGPNVFAPSYDIGGALEWEYRNFTLKGVGMQVGDTTADQRAYHFYGAQIGYRLSTGLGEGNYRLIIDKTSDDFADPQGTNFESLAGAGFSFDQQLGDKLGAWIRFGWQDDKAEITYESIYSGGIDISGKFWGRENDNIGIGYAYLSGGNSTVDKTQVAEAYARGVLNEVFALTLDVQWMKDDLVAGDGPKGFIYSVRMTAEF
jgi:porin